MNDMSAETTVTTKRSAIDPQALPGPQAARVDATTARGKALRVGIISNPHSGQNERHGLLVGVRNFLSAYPKVVQREEESLDGLMAAAREMLEHEVDVIAVNGGDGSVQAVLTGMLRTPSERLPVLAVLPGGTTNVTSHNVGYGKRPLASLQQLVTAAADGALAGTIEPHAVVRVDADGENDAQYGMFFGAGAAYHGVAFNRHEIEARGLHGPAGAALALVTFLFQALSKRGSQLFPPLSADLCMDGESITGETYFGILVSTMSQQILGIRPYYGTGPGPLRYSSLSYRPQQLGRVLIPLLRGMPHPKLRPEFGYRSMNGYELRLKFNSGFTLDGELFNLSGNEITAFLSTRQVGHFLRGGR